jgi:hypothetical protein
MSDGSYDTSSYLPKLKENYLEIQDIVSADPAAAGELDDSEEDPMRNYLKF